MYSVFTPICFSQSRITGLSLLPSFPYRVMKGVEESRPSSQRLAVAENLDPIPNS